MGASMLLNVLPKCNLTKNNREKTIKEEIEGVDINHPELEFALNVAGEEDVTALKKLVVNAVEQYMLFSEDTEVVVIKVNDGPYPVYASGGMTWGDDPTEAYKTISVLNVFPGVYALLCEWALTDMDNED